MATKIGNVVRIGGIRYTIDSVDFDNDGKTTFNLIRNVDNSKWYAKCKRINRFTRLYRRFDAAHANMDRYAATDVLDATFRRI